MESIKQWMYEVALKKAIPSAIRAILAAFCGILVAHAGVLAKAGINYDAAAQTVTLHLGALSDWMVAGGLGLATAALAIIQHHAETIVSQGGTK